MASPELVPHAQAVAAPQALPNAPGGEAGVAKSAREAPAPPRQRAARHLQSLPPDSLAAGLLAAGQDARLGLERLPARRGGRAPGQRLAVLVGALLLLAGALNLGWARAGELAAAVLPRPGGGQATAGPERFASSTRPNASAAVQPDLETLRSVALAAAGAAVEVAPAPGGLVVSISPVGTNYTVVAGDTLERIAQRFGTTVDALVGMNNLGDRNTLRVGQKLIVP